MPRTKAEVERDRAKVAKVRIGPKLSNVVREAALHYEGDVHVLESAVGALFIGQIYGWRVLRIVHGSNAYKRYEAILGIKFNDVCPDRGPLAERSRGLRMADFLGGFWKVATGQVKGARSTIVEDKGTELDLPIEIS